MSDPVQGIYAGIPYIVAEKDGKKYIGIGMLGIDLAAKGANLKLLDDIGDKDPDEVMAAFLESIPEESGTTASNDESVQV